MSVCFLARHLASLKSQRHAQRTQACTHTQTHSHAHRLWRALTFIILWMSGTYSSYTWYLNCAHYSNCCLQFANIFSCWVAETERGGGGTFHWHSECPFWGTQDGAGSPWQRIHQSMWWELEEELWQLFCRWLVSPLPPSASLCLPLFFRCLCVLFVLQFSSIILMQQICRRISCSKEFFQFRLNVSFFFYDFYFFASLRHTHTHSHV